VSPVPNAQVCVHLTVHITKLQLQITFPKPLYIRHFAYIYRDPSHWKSWCNSSRKNSKKTSRPTSWSRKIFLENFKTTFLKQGKVLRKFPEQLQASQICVLCVYVCDYVLLQESHHQYWWFCKSRAKVGDQ
jgi:hypothetical protein